MNTRKLLALAVLSSITTTALADVTVNPAPYQPYVLTSDSKVVRDGSGGCVRTIHYSSTLIRSVTTSDGKPVGVLCGEIKEEAPAAPMPVAAAPAAKPVPAAKPAPAPVAAPAAKKVSLPADAVFAYDKAELSQAGITGLTKFAADAKALKQLEVVIAVGHADRIGSADYNQKLSEKRAATVKNFLIDQGIPANKVYTEGKGESQPVTGNNCLNMGKENGKNAKLVNCLAPDRRVELEAVGTN